MLASDVGLPVSQEAAEFPPGVALNSVLPPAPASLSAADDARLTTVIQSDSISEAGGSTSATVTRAGLAPTLRHDFRTGVNNDWNVWLLTVPEGQHPARDLRLPPSEYARHYLAQSHSFNLVPEGLQFTVHPGDAVVEGDFQRNKDRAEIGRRGLGESEEGQIVEYAMRAKIPANFAVPPAPRGFAFLSQSHVQKGVDFPRGWTMYLGVHAQDELEFEYGTDTTTRRTFSAQFGTWWDLRIRVHWSQQNDGWSEVWLGDQLVVPRISGPNLPTADAMEWKFGIYRGHDMQTTDSMIVQAVAYRVLDHRQALTVNLSSSDTSEATVPNSVDIPANSASVSFPITAVDDTLLDGTQTVTITATANNYLSGMDSLDVLDHERLTVAIQADAISEKDGSSTATVSRSNVDDLSQALTVSLSSNDTSEATVPLSVTIPAGSASATITITAVDDALLDGTQSAIITASADGYFPGDDSLDVTDHETLTVAIATDVISEDSGSTTATVMRSNLDDLSQPLTVDLTSDDTSEATVPASIEIPAGAASATFTITIVDDGLLDGTQTVIITAASNGYVPGSDTLKVTDQRGLAVSILADAISENGGSTTATVTRINVSDLSQPLTVTLVSDDTSEATVPASVEIPADSASATFIITAVDDALLDGTQTATITASAVDFVEGSDSLQVTDHERLTLAIPTDAISENGGSTTATITRSDLDDLSQPLTVSLSSSDTSEATVPASVEIPADSASVTFSITAVDDALLDGNQTVTISPTANGYVSEGDDVDVTDHEQLTLVIQGDAISENGTTTATVTRSNSDDLSQPLTVTLSSDDTSEATVPASVEIPAGSASVTFTITAVDDGVADGSQTVTITAAADGYVSGSDTLEVTEQGVLTVTILSDSISENGGTSTATVTRSNVGGFSQPLTVNLSSDDTSEATVPASIEIPADSASVTFTITAVDDALLDGTQTVTILASADGYLGESDTLEVTDFETLTVSIVDDSVAENGGSTTATVSRSNVDDLSEPLIVSLSSDDASEAAVPGSIEIPADAASVTVTISAIDDALLDGTQTAIITATADGYQAGSDSLDVSDHEILAVSVLAASIVEAGGSTTATVSRSNIDDLSLPLTVTLLSDDTSEATVPASIEIPADSVSATFTVTAIDDAQFDGAQSVSITALADGYVEGSDSVDVLDLSHDLGDAADPTYPTLAASDGARHAVGTLRLGTTVDGEVDGQPTSTFTGDGVDDDGVLAAASMVAMAGVATTSSFRIEASEAGRLDAWIDFDQDGDWEEVGEQIFDSVDVLAGLNLLSFKVPAGATPGATGARFRLSSAGGLSPSGAALDGEVEDYIVTILDGEAAGGAAVDIEPRISGTLDVVADGDDVVVRSGDIDLFQAPGSSLGRLNFMGTDGDDSLNLANLSTIFSGVIGGDARAGDDTLRLTGSGHDLDLTQLGEADIRGVETLDITGSGNNIVTLSMTVVRDISSSGNQLAVLANLGDTVNFGTDWTLTGTRFDDGTFFRVLEQQGTTLLLHGPSNWQNPINNNDVNNNGNLEPVGDILRLINEINVPQYVAENGQLPDPPPDPFPGFFDINGDGFLVSNDVLRNINKANAETPDGEASSVSQVSAGAEGAGVPLNVAALPSPHEARELRGSAVRPPQSSASARGPVEPSSTDTILWQTAVPAGSSAARAADEDERTAWRQYAAVVDELADDDALVDLAFDSILGGSFASWAAPRWRG